MIARHPIIIRQGAYWSLPLTIREDGVLLPLADYEIRMQVRPDVESEEVYLTLISPQNIMILDPGGVVPFLTAEETADLTTWTRGVYDIKFIPPDGRAEFYLEGPVDVQRSVTRS